MRLARPTPRPRGSTTQARLWGRLSILLPWALTGVRSFLGSPMASCGRAARSAFSMFRPGPCAILLPARRSRLRSVGSTVRARSSERLTLDTGFFGYYFMHGFLYSAGRFTTIDVPGAFATQASSINDSGQILRTFVDPPYLHPAPWLPLPGPPLPFLL